MNNIQEKLNNGEGMLQLKKRGWITAIEYSEKTDCSKNKTDWEDWQKDEIILKPTKYDYKIIDDELQLKTFEDRIIDIQNIALNKLDEFAIEVEKLEAQKERLNEIWTQNKEDELLQAQKNYDIAMQDFANGQSELQSCNNEDDYKNALETLAPIFIKYNIKVK